MKTAIRYYSKFGHTEKLVKAIAELAGCDPKTVSEPLEEKVDVLFLGAGIFLSKVDKSVMQFVESLSSDSVGCVALIGSSAIIKEPTKQMRDALQKRNIKVYERDFTCKGSMGPIGAGHPDADDIEALKSFVKEVLK